MVLLLIAIAGVHGWNNGSLVLSMMKAGLGGKENVLWFFIAVGAVLGIVVEGWKMDYKVFLGSPLEITGFLYPLIVTFCLILIGSVLSIPVSYSHVLVMSLIGGAAKQGVFPSSLEIGLLAFGWLLGPFISSAICRASYLLASKAFSTLDLFSLDAINRLSLYIISFLMSYSLAANNIGVLASLMPDIGRPISQIILAISWTIGLTTLGSRIREVIGERIIRYSPQYGLSASFGSSLTMWMFLNLSIPTSITQYLLVSILTMSLSSWHIVGWKTIRTVVLGWIATSFTALIVSYWLT
jgi:PiT family inorganic phosphate transporter